MLDPRLPAAVLRAQYPPVLVHNLFPDESGSHVAQSRSPVHDPCVYFSRQLARRPRGAAPSPNPKSFPKVHSWLWCYGHGPVSGCFSQSPVIHIRNVTHSRHTSVPATRGHCGADTHSRRDLGASRLGPRLLRPAPDPAVVSCGPPAVTNASRRQVCEVLLDVPRG